MSVAVLIPTRGRPQEFLEAVESVRKTSKATVLAYVDEDQRDMYPTEVEGAIIHVGPRVGPVASANNLVRAYPKFDAYGLITDDTRTISPGWDEWLLNAMDMFPKRLAVVSPRHNLGEHVDMPFVSREWINVVGWFACPVFYHYAWPIINGIMGEMTAIVHAPEQGFSLYHKGLPHTNLEGKDKDELKFFHYVALIMPQHVENLRKAMSEA